MGCCGCNNQSSAITAGIFGLIQSLPALVLYSFFWDLYSYSLPDQWNKLDERYFLLFATRDVSTILRIILGVVTISHAVWLISSIVLLIGTCTSNACCIRQWVVVTSFITIGDIILPGVVVGITINQFGDVARSSYQTAQSITNNEEGSFVQVVSSVTVDMYKYYILMIFSFVKGGLITIIINICLNVFTNRRARELMNPGTGYVMMTLPVAVVPQQAAVSYVVPQQMHIASPPAVGYPGNQMQQFPIHQQHQEYVFHSPPGGFLNPQFGHYLQHPQDQPDSNPVKEQMDDRATTESDTLRLTNV